MVVVKYWMFVSLYKSYIEILTSNVLALEGWCFRSNLVMDLEVFMTLLVPL